MSAIPPDSREAMLHPPTIKNGGHEMLSLEVKRCEYSSDCYRVDVRIPDLDLSVLMDRMERSPHFHCLEGQDGYAVFEPANGYSPTVFVDIEQGIIISGGHQPDDPLDALDGAGYFSPERLSLPDRLEIATTVRNILACKAAA
jgi:hypothetical protein